MKIRTSAAIMLAGVLALLSTGCRCGPPDPRPDAAMDAGRDAERVGMDAMTDGAVRNVVGPEGGVVDHPSGVRLEIPAEALDAPTTISIAVSAATSLPSGASSVGTRVELSPDALVVMQPARLTIPIDRARLVEPNAFGDVQVFATSETGADPGWLSGLVREGEIEIALEHFSSYSPALIGSCEMPTDRFETCAVACPGQYHVAGFGSMVCVPGVPWRSIICEGNSGDAYSSCELGCGPGYYLAPGPGVPGCLVTSYCRRIDGTPYDTCELGCRPGYYRSGGAGVSCGVAAGSRCEPLDGLVTYTTCGELGCRGGFTQVASTRPCPGATMNETSCQSIDPGGWRQPPDPCAALDGGVADAGPRDAGPRVDAGVSPSDAGPPPGGSCGRPGHPCCAAGEPVGDPDSDGCEGDAAGQGCDPSAGVCRECLRFSRGIDAGPGGGGGPGSCMGCAAPYPDAVACLSEGAAVDLCCRTPTCGVPGLPCCATGDALNDSDGDGCDNYAYGFGCAAGVCRRCTGIARGVDAGPGGMSGGGTCLGASGCPTGFPTYAGCLSGGEAIDVCCE